MTPIVVWFVVVLAPVIDLMLVDRHARDYPPSHVWEAKSNVSMVEPYKSRCEVT